MTDSQVPLLEAVDVVKAYRPRQLFGSREPVRALDGVSLAVHAGDRLAIVGESGSGKSTLARLLLALEAPTSGEIRFEGAPVSAHQRGSLAGLRRAVQIVFQDPLGSLDPRLTVGDSIAEPLRALRIGGDHRARVAELLTSVGLPEAAARRYPHQFSGGQRQRVAIARALAPSPRVLVADEAVSALDVSVRAQILNLLDDLVERLGLTLVFISHDLAVVRHLCSRVAVLYRGQLVEDASADEVYEAPSHPYTRSLLDAVPRLRQVPPNHDKHSYDQHGHDQPATDVRSTMTADSYESRQEFDLLEQDAAEFGVAWDGPPDVERGTAATSDGAVSFLRWGLEPPRVVLLHGAALNAHTWDVFALAAKTPLLALDLPGHGDSEWRTDAAYSPAVLAATVATVIREHAQAPVTVVGQSLGGLTGIVLAARYPDLVARLVLVDVTPGISNATQVRSFLAGPEVFDSRAQIVERARAFGFGHSDTAVARGVWHNTRLRDDGTVVWKHHFGNLGGIDATAKAGDAADAGSAGGNADGREPGARAPLDFTPLWAGLESFGGPVLLVRGERGFLAEDADDELLRHVPGAVTATVPTGHNVQEDDPVLLAELVTQFTQTKETTR